MANDNYQNNIDSYLKSIDYFEFFERGKIKLDNFVDEIFDNGLFTGELYDNSDTYLIWTGSNRRTQTISFFEGLFQVFPEMSLRLLKLIIRKANLVFKEQTEDGHQPDFRVTLCIEASKYFKFNQKSEKSFLSILKKLGLYHKTVFFVLIFMQFYQITNQFIKKN